MNKLVGVTGTGIVFLVVFVHFLRNSAALEVDSFHGPALSTRTASEASSDKENWRRATNEEQAAGYNTVNGGADDLGGEFAAEGDSKILNRDDDAVNETGRELEQVNELNELFNPFVAFPFFPFHVPDLKRNAFRVNSSAEGGIRSEEEGDRSGRGGSTKQKPFVFIDFAFNIEEIPVKNESRERQSSLADSLFPVNGHRGHDKRDGKTTKARKGSEELPFDLLDDDWSFFDDLAFLPPDVDDFLPKPKLELFDLPFSGKQAVKQSRSRRDKSMVQTKRETNIIQGIFDQAMSSMKREMEKTMPLWDFLVSPKKTVRGDEHKGNPLDKISSPVDEIPPPQHAQNSGNQSAATNAIQLIPDEMFFRKDPVVTGKVVKIGEIHIRGGHSKSKNKRRSARGLGKREKQGVRENSNKGRHKDEQIKAKFANFEFPSANLNELFPEMLEESSEGKAVEARKDSERTVRRTEILNEKMSDFTDRWDRGKMKEKAEGKSSNTKETETVKSSDDGDSPILRYKKYKHVGLTPKHKQASMNNAGFEVLKTQPTSPRKTRQDNAVGRIWENVTASKDDVRRNITEVLGQFFSMIRKLGESKDRENDDNHEIDDLLWPVKGHLHSPRSYGDDGPEKRMREVREVETFEEDAGPAPVADINFLFLTVTLPTTIAFTLLLVICIINLRANGSLCKKVFQPRNLYLVEEDVEKARPVDIEANTGKEKRTKTVDVGLVLVKDAEKVKAGDAEKAKRNDADKAKKQNAEVSKPITTASAVSGQVKTVKGSSKDGRKQNEMNTSNPDTKSAPDVKKETNTKGGK